MTHSLLFNLHSPQVVHSFREANLEKISGTLCSGTIAFSDVFELELVVTCSRGVFRNRVFMVLLNRKKNAFFEIL